MIQANNYPAKNHPYEESSGKECSEFRKKIEAKNFPAKNVPTSGKKFEAKNFPAKNVPVKNVTAMNYPRTFVKEQFSWPEKSFIVSGGTIQLMIYPSMNFLNKTSKANLALGSYMGNSAKSSFIWFCSANFIIVEQI
jgi:hypothetical protein